ncbi:MAG TPA: hypothetical protein VH082_02005 [Rudaea sp.]|jgi:hypothetical protein|nr:hypothetical protein [Rudaea sp.]
MPTFFDDALLVADAAFDFSTGFDAVAAPFVAAGFALVFADVAGAFFAGCTRCAATGAFFTGLAGALFLTTFAGAFFFAGAAFFGAGFLALTALDLVLDVAMLVTLVLQRSRVIAYVPFTGNHFRGRVPYDAATGKIAA